MDERTDALLPAQWRIPVGDEHVAGVFEPALQPGADTVFVCAHGAGGHMDDRGMLALAAQLRSRSMHVVRFNFLYRERKSNRPDAMPLLEQCIEAVVAH